MSNTNRTGTIDILPNYNSREAKAARAAELASLERIQASRPLKPPPFNFGPHRARVAAMAVREDRKAGVLV